MFAPDWPGDPERTSRARMLIWVGWIIVVLSILGYVATPLLDTSNVIWMVGIGAQTAVALTAILLARAGHITTASRLLVVSTWVLATAGAVASGGVDVPAVVAQFAFVVVAGLVLDWKSAAAATVISTLTLLALGAWQAAGMLPEPAFTTTLYVRVHIIATYVVTVGVLTIFVTARLRSAQRRAEGELADRRAAESALHLQHDLAVALGGAGTLASALDLVLDAALRITAVDCGGVYLVDESSGDLVLVTSRGLPEPFVAAAAHFAAGSPNALVVACGEPVYSEYLALADVTHAGEARRAEGLLAAAVVPIAFEDRAVGALNLASHTSHTFPADGRVAMETLAAQIGGAIARVRAQDALVARSEELAALHHAEEEKNRRLDALVGAGRQITSRLTMPEVLDNIVHLAAESVRAPLAYLYEYESARDVLVTRSRYGFSGPLGRDEAPGTEFDLADTPDDRRAIFGDEVFVETISDLELHPATRLHMLDAGERTLVNVPLRFAGEPLGMLVLIETDRERAFSTEELDYLHAFGEQAAIALNNSHLYETIASQATLDPLTGLANRRTFTERLEQEVSRTHRFGTPVSLLMLDVDDFKAINDRYGHPAGDDVLRRIGRILTEEVRDGVDLACRVGGEEFAVILPGATCDDDGPARTTATAVAERIRSRCAATAFPVGEDLLLRVTVSIGATACLGLECDATGLTVQADDALYDVKRTGKNGVRAHKAA